MTLTSLRRHTFALALLCVCSTSLLSWADEGAPPGKTMDVLLKPAKPYYFIQGPPQSPQGDPKIRRGNPFQGLERRWNLRDDPKMIKKRSIAANNNDNSKPCWLPFANQQQNNESDKDLGILNNDFHGQALWIHQSHLFYLVRSNDYDGNQTSDFRLYEKFMYYDEMNARVSKDWFRNIYNGYREENNLDRKRAKVLRSYPNTIFWIQSNTTSFLYIRRALILDSFRVDGNTFDQYLCAVRTPERFYEYPVTVGLLDNYLGKCSVMRIDGQLARLDKFFILAGKKFGSPKLEDCYQEGNVV